MQWWCNGSIVKTHSSKFLYLIVELAHLVRALVWQTRGDEFDSRILHKNKKIK